MNDGQPPTISNVGSLAQIDAIGGTLGAELDVSAKVIPSVMGQLDSIAKQLVTSVNAVHNGASVFSNTTPPVASVAGNFFDVTVPPPAGTDPLLTARSIRVVQTLTAAGVAASAAGATGPGNNDVALALSQMQTKAFSFTDANGGALGTATFGTFFNQTVGTVAAATAQAQDDSTVDSTLASNADTRRQSVSGVSTDEELVNIIQFQHAYQAAARLVTVVNEMTDTLVNLGR